jgi:hypothetical protein
LECQGKNKQEDKMLLNLAKEGIKSDWDKIAQKLSESGFPKTTKQSRER